MSYIKTEPNTVTKRILTDIELGYIPRDIFTLTSKKFRTDYDIKFKINVWSDYKYCYQVGSLIRSIVSLLTNIDTYKIMIIIDMSSCAEFTINIGKLINQLIYVSTASVILTNVFLVLPDIILNNKLFLKQQSKKLLSEYVTIINTEHLSHLIANYTEFNIAFKNNNDIFKDFNTNKNKHGIFKDFNPDKNYIPITFIKHILTNLYSPVIYQLASYKNFTINTPIIIPQNIRFVMCIQKCSNIHRIYDLLTLYNIKDVIICPSTIDNNVITYCNNYSIPHYNSIDILKMLSNSKNIIAVDIHKEAITLEYSNKNILNTILNPTDNVFIFGYELGGIPEEFLELCTKHVQFKARKSVNVVAAFSILLSIIFT